MSVTQTSRDAYNAATQMYNQLRQNHARSTELAGSLRVCYNIGILGMPMPNNPQTITEVNIMKEAKKLGRPHTGLTATQRNAITRQTRLDAGYEQFNGLLRPEAAMALRKLMAAGFAQNRLEAVEKALIRAAKRIPVKS